MGLSFKEALVSTGEVRWTRDWQTGHQSCNIAISVYEGDLLQLPHGEYSYVVKAARHAMATGRFSDVIRALSVLVCALEILNRKEDGEDGTAQES